MLRFVEMSLASWRKSYAKERRDGERGGYSAYSARPREAKTLKTGFFKKREKPNKKKWFFGGRKRWTHKQGKADIRRFMSDE